MEGGREGREEESRDIDEKIPLIEFSMLRCFEK